MAYRVTEFETTPNPNALKCWLDKPISTGPQSFLDAEMARNHPIARALFERAGATCVLLNGDWLTVNKSAQARWPAVKSHIRSVLAEAPD